MPNVRASMKLLATIAGCAAVALVAATASAEPQIFRATEDPFQISQFTLDFGILFGGETSAQISTTDFEIEVDEVAGTARFVSYHQAIAPLTLPGGISTGNIIVEIVPGSSQGVFDPETQTFLTTEDYAISFEGDLSAFDLESPVILPSTSTGALVRDARPSTARLGSVNMVWDGASFFADPTGNFERIDFTYTCQVNTFYSSAGPGLLTAIARTLVDSALADQNLASTLMSVLGEGSDALAAGSTRDARDAFNDFIDIVEQAGASLTDEQAESLAGDAQELIDTSWPIRQRSGLQTESSGLSIQTMGQ